MPSKFCESVMTSSGATACHWPVGHYRNSHRAPKFLRTLYLHNRCSASCHLKFYGTVLVHRCKMTWYVAHLALARIPMWHPNSCKDYSSTTAWPIRAISGFMEPQMCNGVVIGLLGPCGNSHWALVEITIRYPNVFGSCNSTTGPIHPISGPVDAMSLARWAFLWILSMTQIVADAVTPQSLDWYAPI